MALFDWEQNIQPVLPEEENIPPFQACMAMDVRQTFLNSAEYAEERTIHYDGETFENIPVVETGLMEGKRSSVIQMQSDFGQGLFRRTVHIYCSMDDLHGIEPEQGSYLSMNEKKGGTFFHKYRVAESSSEMGMYHLKLEEVDE